MVPWCRGVRHETTYQPRVRVRDRFSNVTYNNHHPFYQMNAESLCIMVTYCLRTIRTSRVPELDRNEASPWHRISHTSPDQSRAGTGTNVVKCMMTAQRSMVINIPIGIMQQSLGGVADHGEMGEPGDDTVLGRLLHADTQAHATAALLNLMDGVGSDLTALGVKPPKLTSDISVNPCSDTRKHLHTKAQTDRGNNRVAIPSFVWCVEAILSEQRTEQRTEQHAVQHTVAGLRLWKHILDPRYSDALQFDVQIASAQRLQEAVRAMPCDGLATAKHRSACEPSGSVRARTPGAPI